MTFFVKWQQQTIAPIVNHDIVVAKPREQVCLTRNEKSILGRCVRVATAKMCGGRPITKLYCHGAIRFLQRIIRNLSFFLHGSRHHYDRQ
jgi:hypothetical protein